MNLKIAAFVAVLTAVVELLVLWAYPAGRLEANQLLLLISSVVTGVTVLLLWPASKEQSLPPLQSAAVGGLALALIILLAFAVPRPLAAGLAQQITADLNRDCVEVLENWPAKPAAAEFRQLEWSLKRATVSLRELADARTKAGLQHLPLHQSAIERALMEHKPLSPTLRSLSPPPVPAGREGQYERMQARVEEAAQELCAEAKRLHVPSVVAWAESIERAIAQLAPKSEISVNPAE